MGRARGDAGPLDDLRLKWGTLVCKLQYRQAVPSDIPAMAQIRACEWGTLEYWTGRIGGYLSGTHHPRQALVPRVAYVALEGKTLVAFVAGHLTRRFQCDGELEWIHVVAEHRRSGIASDLLRLLAEWFIAQKAPRVCVDVDPTNLAARRFYIRHGAIDLNAHWLMWNDISVVGAKALIQRRANPLGSPRGVGN